MEQLTPGIIFQALAVLIVLWKGFEEIDKMIDKITSRHDREKGWDKAVETIAENTSDGIIAPMFYLAIGGPILGICYKAINTMDSMIGYKNDKYLDFGRYAAKLDDVVNFLPARISAWAMIFSCYILGKEYDGKNAKRIFIRDRFNHASPNSAQTESVCAGALGLQLAGPTSYFGKMVQKEYIGDRNRAVEREDIRRANKLMITTAVICEVIACMVVTFIEIIYTLIFR